MQETWNNPRELATRTITLGNGDSSEAAWTYNGWEQPTEKDEYGAANESDLMRKMLTTYATFSPAHIVDRPASVAVEDGSGCEYGLTEYGYDQSPTGSIPGVVQHDDGNFGTGYTTRGNLTSISRMLGSALGGCLGSSPAPVTTSFAYDETGQRTSETEPNGSSTTVQFSYADNYASGR